MISEPVDPAGARQHAVKAGPRSRNVATRDRASLAAAGSAVTDEASAIEAAGHAPKLVAGSLENFKITWPADFALAERLLRTR